MAAEAGVPLSPSAVTSVLVACAKRSRWREALDLLQDARPVLRQAFSSPLPSRKAAGAPRVAEEGGGGAKGKGSVVAAYTLAMAACRRADRHADGLQVLSMLEEDGGQGDEQFFRVALKCCAKAAGGVGDESRGGGCSGAAAADRVLGDMSALGIRCRVEGFTDVAQVGAANRETDRRDLVEKRGREGGVVRVVCVCAQTCVESLLDVEAAFSLTRKVHDESGLLPGSRDAGGGFSRTAESWLNSLQSVRVGPAVCDA